MACLGCGRGFHEECLNGDCISCHGEMDQKVKSFTGGRGAPTKSVEDINDPYSTGRKRAAIKFPIHGTNPCEWRGLKNCGGGQPIIGCLEGIQVDRHHGPIKNPLRNEKGNVHRICKPCHNRWHVINDPVYNELEYEHLPHEPEIAENIELVANDVYWRSKK